VPGLKRIGNVPRDVLRRKDARVTHHVVRRFHHVVRRFHDVVRRLLPVIIKKRVESCNFWAF
jgi:hypothetical protein